MNTKTWAVLLTKEQVETLIMIINGSTPPGWELDRPRETVDRVKSLLNVLSAELSYVNSEAEN